MRLKTFLLIFLCSILFHCKLVSQYSDTADFIDQNKKNPDTWSTMKIHDTIAAPGVSLVRVDALNFLGDNGLVGAISLHINIDTNLVTFLGIANTTLSGSWYSNYNNQLHEITILYSAPIGTGYDINGKLFDLNLFYKGGFEATLDFKPNCEVTNKNLQTIHNIYYLDGSINQTQPVGTATIEDVACLPATSFTTPLTIQGAGLNSINSIHLRISYDSLKVTFTGFSPGPISNINLVSQPNLLLIDWIDEINPIDLTILTTIVNLEFYFAGQGNTNLNFEPGSYVRSGNIILPMSFENGAVNQLFNLNLTATPAEGGLVTGNGTYTSGTLVTATATANDNFTFGYWSNGSNVVSTNPDYQFLMPEQNVFLTAHFISSNYLLSLEPNPLEGGTVSGGGFYPPGQNIEVSAVAGPTYNFVNWTLNNAVISDSPVFDYTMPDENVVLQANFTGILYPLTLQAIPTGAGTLNGGGDYLAGQQITVNATANTGYEFVNWTKDGVIISVQPEFVFTMPAAPAILQANFEQTSFFLVLESNPTGAGYLIGDGFYEPLSMVEISATSLDGFEFINWTNNGEVVSTQSAFTYTMPATNTVLTANFLLVGYALTLEVQPENAGLLCCSGYYLEGEIFPVSALEASGFDFVNWTENGEQISTSPTFDYTMPDHPVTLVGHFIQTGHILTTEVTPAGSGFVYGAGVYDEGETVALSAESYPSYQFVNWTINGDVVSYATHFDYIMPANDVQIDANFTYIGFELALTSSPPGACQLTGEGFYDAGEQVNVAATNYPGFYFLNWTQNSNIISNQPEFVYTMPPSNTSLQANFVPIDYILTLLEMPANSGQTEGDGIYHAGDQVTIVAIPETGFEFDNWTLNGDVFSESATFSFEMPLNNLTLTANFSLQEFEILAVPNNDIYGTVTGSGTYVYGETANVTAIPNTSYYFVLWTENEQAVSYDASYSFVVNNDRNLIGHFQQESSCPGPVALGVTDVSETSASLIWYPADDNEIWDVLWGLHGFDTISEGNLINSLNTNTYLLEGLQRNTAYDFYVRTVCSAENHSSWAGPESFTTLLTNLENLIKNVDMVMYPNPCHDKLTVKFDRINKKIQLKIIDVAGAVVFWNDALSASESTILLPNLKPGMYLIHATDGDFVITRKLIIY
jgi:hypothetical protein